MEEQIEVGLTPSVERVEVVRGQAAEQTGDGGRINDRLGAVRVNPVAGARIKGGNQVHYVVVDRSPIICIRQEKKFILGLRRLKRQP